MPKHPKWIDKPLWAQIQYRLRPGNGRVAIKGVFDGRKEAEVYAKLHWAPGASFSINYLAPATRADLQPSIPFDSTDKSGPTIEVETRLAVPFQFPFGNGHVLIMR